MAAGALLLLLLLLSGLRGSAALSFYGDSITLAPPQRQKDGTFKVTFVHRQNGRGSCLGLPSYSCDSGECSALVRSSVLPTDRDGSAQRRWCQAEERTTATVTTNGTSFSLRNSGCCWASNVEGKTSWTAAAQLDLGTRSDSHRLNSCPVSASVSSLRVPQNCFSRLRLLAHDPDGDAVRCSFSQTAPANFTLDEAACTLMSGGQVPVGVHVFELTVEDFPRKNITLTYADGTAALRRAFGEGGTSLCSVRLQFTVEVLPPIASCDAGHVLPMFLSTTPSQGDVLHATVGQKFQLFARAQAHHGSIQDFQVSGPHNTTKEFRDEPHGRAEVALTWTPPLADLHRHVPLCFTAETNDTQSEMRCVVVMVTQASVIQGKAIVSCEPNKMEVAVEKASMPGIDETFLQLADPSCSLTSNGTHITGSMSFGTCGTTVEDKGDFIVFKNEINSFQLPTEVITRRKEVRIDFSCLFPKTISVSSYYDLHRSDYIFTESRFGSFGYSFEIFQDRNFTEPVAPAAYPVQVKLLQTVFMGIRAQAALPSVQLFVESCKATPDDDPGNKLSYDLIKDGCIKDETFKIHPSNESSFNFEVQAFKFTGNFDQVYITCSVILCESGSSFSRCAQGCLKDPARRRRRGLAARETQGHYITQGPLQFVSGAAPNAAVDADEVVTTARETPRPVVRLQEPPQSRVARVRHFLSSNVSTLVFASAFLLSLVVLAAVVLHFVRKRKADDQNSLLVADWEE